MAFDRTVALIYFVSRFHGADARNVRRGGFHVLQRVQRINPRPRSFLYGDDHLAFFELLHLHFNRTYNARLRIA